MPLAAENFRDLTLDTDYKALTEKEDIQSALRRAIADTQQNTLSRMDDSISRQLGSILFSHEAGLIAALDTVEPPTVEWEKEKLFTLPRLLSLAGAALSILAAYLAFDKLGFFLFLLLLAGALLMIVSAFWPGKKRGAKITQKLNSRALFQLAERRMEAIDRDLEAYLSIPGSADEDDEGVTQLILKAVSLKREDPDCIPDELMTVITALSISRGYALMEYTGENDELFDVMPTIRQTRTIVPALMKGGRLIAKGLAIHKTNENTEEA